MSADEDEEAFSWAGDSDSSYVAGPKVPEPVKSTSDAPVAKPGIPSILLITYGVLAGLYLIYTVGWIVAVQRLSAARVASSDLLSEAMFQLGEFLAMASPAIWFGAVFLLTRDRKPIVRLCWILVGLVAVLPWPFALGAWA